MLWKNKYTQAGIVFSLAVVGIHAIAFPNYIMSGPILLMGLTIILFFYLSVKFYNGKWIETEKFGTKLFVHSFVFRIIAIIGMYVVTYIYQPESLPFEFGAMDAWNYHWSGELVANTLKRDGNIFAALSGFWKSENDYGFSIYVGIVYYVFGPSLNVIKILNALWGSITAVRIYQIGQQVYGEKKARMAGILTMLFPSLLWFTAMLLKETILIFLLVNLAYYIIRITDTPEKGLKYIAYFLLCAIPLFYFRAFLLPLVIISVVLHVLFYRTKSRRQKIISRTLSFFVLAGLTFMVYQFKLLDSFIIMADQGSTAFSTETTASAIQRGISYKTALIAPFMLAGALITPLPSLMHFDDNQLGIYMHFQNELIRNFMYFFVFIGIFQFIKQRQRKMVYIFALAFGYISILAISGVAFQDRFQVLALPFLILFIPEGLESNNLQRRSKLNVYLFFIFVAILSWNLFKLSIRQLV